MVSTYPCSVRTLQAKSCGLRKGRGGLAPPSSPDGPADQSPCFASRWARVLTPPELVHLISTRSVLACSAATVVERFDGTLQVTPFTVIEVVLAAVTMPRASTVPGFDVFSQPPVLRRTALPPLVAPPILPPMKPLVDVQFPETLAISLFHEAEPWPSARPAKLPPLSITASN